MTSQQWLQIKTQTLGPREVTISLMAHHTLVNTNAWLTYRPLPSILINPNANNSTPNELYLQSTRNTDVVVDEVEVVTWSDGHRTTSALCNAVVCLMQRLMYKDKSGDDCVAMARQLQTQITDGHRFPRWNILNTQKQMNAKQNKTVIQSQ